MKRILCFLVAIAVTAAASGAQDWVPAHIVAVTDYPRLAWIAVASGDVVVRCLLNKDGSVAKAEALSGPGLLKEKTVQNATLWRFRQHLRGKSSVMSLSR
jgi:outer membrane biosynthesis protein TonB